MTTIPQQMSTPHDEYVTDEATGERWTALLGDSCERISELADDSVDLWVQSPPFASLYVYSPTPRDLGNCSTREEFFEHYGFVIREQLRTLKPGRLCAVHVQQVTLQKVLHGHVGLTDFRGEVIDAYTDAGWIFHGEATVDKDPQAQAIRTKAQSLLFVTKDKDSSMLRPALADYLLLFRKPGENAVPVKTDVSHEEWIAWARPVWLDIRETDTLNAAAGRDQADERHIAPLQLPFIERVVRLYSNRDELVASAFGGIGSEGFVAVREGRRSWSCELKASYWRQAVKNLQRVERDAGAELLWDETDLVELTASS